MLAAWAADTGQLLLGIAAVLTAVGLLHGQRVIAKKVNEVHTEVKTANGITMAALADRAEGRRVEETVDIGDRTTSEQGYVDMLDEGGRNIGHEDQP